MHQAYAADLLVQVGSLANADFISMTGRSNDLMQKLFLPANISLLLQDDDDDDDD